jgi:hypothetical protein
MKLFQGLSIAVLLSGFVYLCLESLSMPDVWFSYSTDECVKVINYDKEDQFSCENLPTKFNHVWIK